MYFKVVMEGEHVGAAESSDVVRYLEADDGISLLRFIDDFPGRKTSYGNGIKIVEPITKEEYEAGKNQAVPTDSSFISSREHPRFIIKQKCLIKNGTADKTSTEIMATTIDYSHGGIALKYGECVLPEGVTVHLDIDNLRISNKEAEVCWSVFHEGASYSGLKWR